ncbi:MAG: hypothetical protein LBE18_08980 [Planctomycetaceae bacterium]|jgi:hypothetical protein|nr:hypothetical protein [Planctomycetaceae bacterium]
MKLLHQLFLILFIVCCRLITTVNYCNAEENQVQIESADQVKIESIKVGIEGNYKSGLWTAVLIKWSIPNQISDDKKITSISIDSIDSDGTPITYRKEISTDKSNNNLLNRSAVIYFKPGRYNAKITVNLESGGKIVATNTIVPKEKTVQQKNVSEYSYDNSFDNFIFRFPIHSERQIILIIGNEDIGLQGAIAELALREERRPLIVKINSVAELPDQWYGYEAIDMIVLTTTEPDQLKNLNVQSPQICAIDKWIKSGGRMLFCAGRNTELLIKKSDNAELYDSPLTPFLPGKFEKMTDLRKGDLLESFILSKRKIQIETANDFILIPSISNHKGLIRLKDGDLPIISQYMQGFGTIIYFAGDLSGKPLANWRDRTTLVRKILQWDLNKQNVKQQDMPLIRPAYNDISGQIRSAADRFDEIKILPFSLILIILVMYWSFVSVGDWFIIRKLLKRPILTWITFPLWILLFGGISYLLLINGHSNRTILREFIVIDLNPEQNVFRSSIWANLYSPSDSHYSLRLSDYNNVSDKNVSGKNLSGHNVSGKNVSGTNLLSTNVSGKNVSSTDANQVEDQVIDRETAFLSWFGLTGDGIGGMNPKTYNPTTWRNGSIQEQAAEIKNVPIQIRSTKSFYGERFGTDKDNKININSIKSKLVADESLPIGEILFDGTPAMKDVILIYGRWLIPLGVTPTSGQIKIDKKSQRQDIGDIILSKTALDSDSIRYIATYNTQSPDFAYIVKVLSVHERLGGYETIGLFNTFQRSLDMSNFLATNQAILIGECETNQFVTADRVEISVPVDRRSKTILRYILQVTSTTPQVILGNDRLERIDPSIENPIEEDDKLKNRWIREK